MMSNVFSIIVAAGLGKRFGSPKPFAALKGKRILDHSLETFNSHPGISEMVLVLRETSEKAFFFDRFKKIKAVVAGGERRQDSVFSGFQQINPARGDIVLIHDAARPLVKAELIDAIIEKAREKGAAIPVLPVSDTIKMINGDRVSQTFNRQGMFLTQTPQGFSCEILLRAFKGNGDNQDVYTDEAALLEKQGQDVFVVPGDPSNLKITFPEDLKIAEALFEN
ncbi:2-C-methyl-D-erythritol 4-phosphate cytidylyltransferase [Acidobacteriota bacterium]